MKLTTKVAAATIVAMISSSALYAQNTQPVPNAQPFCGQNMQTPWGKFCDSYFLILMLLYVCVGVQLQDSKGAVVAEASSLDEDPGEVQDKLRRVRLWSAGARRLQPHQGVGHELRYLRLRGGVTASSELTL